MEKTFLEFITAKGNKEIINVLCRIRAREADKRSKDDKMKRLSSEYKCSKGYVKHKESSLIYQIMPPRRKWVQLGQSNRTHKGDFSQRITSYDYNKKAIIITILRDLKKCPESPYIGKLKEFIADFVKWVKGEDFAFNNIEVIPIPKRYEDKVVECRPVTMFTDLKESLLLVLINKFLTHHFDNWFYEESLAFRSKRLYHGMEKVTSHHDAVSRICDYREKFAGKDIYVAECDIKKFYDTVSHQIVRRAFNKLFKRLESRNGYKYDLEKKIVWAFLRCYTFPRNVLRPSEQKSYWERRGIFKGEFKWVKKELISEGLYKKNSITKARIGVPQGGALSGLIANAVLDAVDKRVEGVLTEEDLYLRYCDDMILLSTDKERCESIFMEYQNSMKELRLISHKHSAEVYKRRTFWKNKTKLPYLWGIGAVEAPEWIGFVGYEIKRDGCIRIRKKSLHREIKKQREYATNLFEKLKNLKRVSDDTIAASVINHLINMSVGRVTIWNAAYIHYEQCWMNGFRGLNDNKYSRRQIKMLDCCRNNTIKIAVEKFKGQNLSDERKEKYKGGSKKKDERLCGAVRFYGKPYSYFYHFLRIVEKRS